MSNLIPNVVFKTRTAQGWKDISTTEIFQNKKVVVFSLPGAFTPTCSSSHVPRYNELAPVFKQNGIDEIVCISVNDGFVMYEWALDQKANNITFIPDGNGEFTEKVGMLVDKSNLGFGKRSWRYSMLVNNMVIEKMFVEPEKPGDPFEVSDADTMLNFINPNAKKPDQVAIFTRDGCEYCFNAKTLLQQHNLNYEEVKLPHNTRGKILGAVAGKMSVPQIFINGNHIGGYTELTEYLKSSINTPVSEKLLTISV